MQAVAEQAAEHAEGSALEPQISLEAAKLQQLGASMGTKLRPESAQKIQVSLSSLKLCLHEQPAIENKYRQIGDFMHESMSCNSPNDCSKGTRCMPK